MPLPDYIIINYLTHCNPTLLRVITDAKESNNPGPFPVPWSLLPLTPPPPGGHWPPAGAKDDFLILKISSAPNCGRV